MLVVGISVRQRSSIAALGLSDGGHFLCLAKSGVRTCGLTPQAKPRESDAHTQSPRASPARPSPRTPVGARTRIRSLASACCVPWIGITRLRSSALGERQRHRQRCSWSCMRDMPQATSELGGNRTPCISARVVTGQISYGNLPSLVSPLSASRMISQAVLAGKLPLPAFQGPDPETSSKLHSSAWCVLHRPWARHTAHPYRGCPHTSSFSLWQEAALLWF